MRATFNRVLTSPMKADNRTFFSRVLPKAFLLLLFLLLNQLTFTGCRKDEEAAPGATPMTLLTSLDGKAWEASGFLVERTVATATSDDALLISSRSNAGGIWLNLYLHGVDITLPSSVTYPKPGSVATSRATICGLRACSKWCGLSGWRWKRFSARGCVTSKCSASPLLFQIIFSEQLFFQPCRRVCHHPVLLPAHE